MSMASVTLNFGESVKRFYKVKISFNYNIESELMGLS